MIKKILLCVFLCIIITYLVFAFLFFDFNWVGNYGFGERISFVFLISIELCFVIMYGEE